MNWCKNYLQIYHPIEKMTELISPMSILNSFQPSQKWGTEITDIHQEPYKVSFSFVSESHPPIEALKWAESHRGYQCILYYVEYGMGTVGCYQDGGHKIWEIPKTEWEYKQFLKNLPEHMIEILQLEEM